MNGVVKWLFMFVFGFIAAFSFMFSVNGTLKPSNKGVEEYVVKPYSFGEIATQRGITINAKGLQDGVFGITGKINQEVNNTLFTIFSGAHVKVPTEAKLQASFTGDIGAEGKEAYIRIYIDYFHEDASGKLTWVTQETIPIEKGPYIYVDVYGKSAIEKEANRCTLYVQVIDNTKKYDFDAIIRISVKAPVEIKAQNMLTWFTNVVNTTKQQSFWDFVKAPIQRFIDKMSYFDSLEKPSFAEVLTAIWNVFLLMLSPIEIIGRALWWLALVLYDLIPLLLNPTWV